MGNKLCNKMKDAITDVIKTVCPEFKFSNGEFLIVENPPYPDLHIYVFENVVSLSLISPGYGYLVADYYQLTVKLPEWSFRTMREVRDNEERFANDIVEWRYIYGNVKYHTYGNL